MSQATRRRHVHRPVIWCLFALLFFAVLLPATFSVSKGRTLTLLSGNDGYGRMASFWINKLFAARDKIELPVSVGRNGAFDNASTGLAATATTNMTATSDPTIVACWKLDEGAGQSAQDSTGNGNAGTVVGAGWSAGQIGAGALSFDGVDDYVNVNIPGNSALNNVTNNFTLSFWAYPRSEHEIDGESTSGYVGLSGQRYVFGPSWYDVGTSRAGAGISVGTNGVSVYEHAGGYLPAVLVYDASQKPLSGWTHIALVYANHVPKLYINGTLVRTGLVSGMSSIHINPWNLGGTSYGSFDGQLDDIRVYNRPLASDQISDMITESSLAAYWKFDEGSGQSVVDSTGNNNTGTIQGASWGSGRVGTASLDFRGASGALGDNVSVASNSSVTNLANNFTVSFWTYPRSPHQIDGESASGFAGLGGQRYIFGPGWHSTASGSAGAGISVGTNGVSVYEHADGYIPATLVWAGPLNGWTHVAVVYENHLPKLYINGRLVRTGVVSAKTYIRATPAGLGGFAYGSFDGQLDDMRIYKRPLTMSEVAALSSTPFRGASAAVPGTIEAENFNDGGEGFAYHDNVPGSQGQDYDSPPSYPPPAYHSPTDVDIHKYRYGYSNGHIIQLQAMEWLNYSVNINTSGTYSLEVRTIWGDAAGGTFHVEIDGVNKTGPIQIPDSAWAFTTVRGPNVQLESGRHMMRVVADTNASNGSTGDIDYLKFTFLSAPPAPTPTPTPTPTPNPNPTPTPAPSSIIATLPLSFEGRLRDRVSQNETTLTGDGAADGTFTVTFPAEVNGQTLTGLRLDRGDGVNAWDTTPNNGTWAIGVARTLDSDLLNSANSAVSLPIAGESSLELFVADGSALFAPGRTFTLNATFSNGSTAKGEVTLVQGGGDFSLARLDARNRTGGAGVDLFSGNYSWSMPVVSLSGRAGLDLDLSLVYNSLVWTRNDSSIKFDADKGFPSPGFRLGFPVIQPRFFNPQTGKNTYLMILPSGERVELRQVSANTYESADSSYLQLTVGVSVLTVKTISGTRLSFTLSGGEYHCTEIKDRNGNLISLNNDSQGRINTITDTVGRVLTFNYDSANGALTSITQPWNVNGQSLSHKWAEFSYTTINLQTNFGDLTMVGAQNNENIRVLQRVTYADGTGYSFTYTSWGQVYGISRFASDGSLLRYTKYNMVGSTFPQSIPLQNDCPRFTQQSDAAKNWNGASNSINSGSEATTLFSIAAVQGNGVGEMTTPDGAKTKEFFATTGWQNGLTQKVETWSPPTFTNGVGWTSGVLKKTATTVWTQDNEGLTFMLNPRPTDITIVDGEGSRRRRTHYDYNDPANPYVMAFGLVASVSEFGSNDAAPLRRTQMKYNHSPAYLSSRVVSLVSEQTIYDGQGLLAARTTYEYDLDGFLQATSATPRQHDSANLGIGFREGRGNLSRVRRMDITDSANINKSLVSEVGYNTTGSPIFTRFFSYDDFGSTVARQTNISYADALNTFAYPTSVTDPEGYKAQVAYNYDLAVVMSTTNPRGAIQTTLYDSVTGRVTRTEINNRSNPNDPDTGSYARFVYSPDHTGVETYTRVDVGHAETYSAQVFDGAGRVRGTVSSFPGSTGGYRAQRFTYDVMGQLVEQSNPTEVSVDPTRKLEMFYWNPDGDDAGTGWRWSRQAYDWKGRPTVTTNVDGTKRTLSYEGCGCAGGDVVSSSDEVGRKQKSYADALGRVTKIEVWNLNDTVYATTLSSYNALDQMTNVKQYKGEEASGDFQETTVTYDGYGRLFKRHLPEQRDANNQQLSITYGYNPDDTLRSVTDARGATMTLFYNGRQMVKKVVYGRPIDSTTNQPKASISETATVELDYDGAGNRRWMKDGLGRVDYNYDTWGMLRSETRYFNNLLASSPSSTGEARQPFTLSYDYTLSGDLKKLTDTVGDSVNYVRDEAGQLISVTGSAFANVTTYATDIKYRAWGAPKSVRYGDSGVATTTYNSRMRPSEYTLNIPAIPSNFNIATSMRERFEYYDDGRLRQMTDLDDKSVNVLGEPPADRRFSRRLAYDNAGRIKSAVGIGASGQDHGLPYRQSYSYDEFDNLKERSGSYYYEGSTVDTAQYQNNRRQDWIYDESGMVTRSPITSTSSATTGARDWTYDAAARVTKVIDTRTTNNTTTTSTYVVAYDGDGQPGFEQSNNSQSVVASYSIRSTVLDGSVVTLLDEGGKKSKTTVRVDGLLTALQQAPTFSGGQPSVTWLHRDPSGLSEVTNTSSDKKAVYDPLGNYISYQTPPAPATGFSPLYSPPPGGLMGSGVGFNGGSTNVTCTLNSLPVDCGTAMHMLDIGSAAPCLNNNCGPQFVRGADGKPAGWIIPNGSGGLFYSDGEDSGWIDPDDLEFRDASDPNSWAMSLDRKKRSKKQETKRKPKTQWELILAWQKSKIFWDKYYAKSDANARAFNESQMTREPKPEITPEQEQADFDACAKRAFRAFRKDYIKQGGKAALAGILLGVGGVTILEGIPMVAGSGLGIRAAQHFARAGELGEALHALEGAGLLALTPIGGGIHFAQEAVKEGNISQAKLDSDLATCKKQSPRANHRGAFLNF